MELVAEFIELRSAQDKLSTVCRCAERHYEGGETVAIHTADQAQADELDGLLWTSKQNSFVPHVIMSQAQEPVLEPVFIVVGEEELPDTEVLIVASGREPDGWLGRVGHVCDFAEVYDDKLRAAARARYKKYSDAGYRMRFIR